MIKINKMLSFLSLVLLMTFTVLSLAEAAIISGKWTLQEGNIENGFWFETFGTPGSPGAGNNELDALLRLWITMGHRGRSIFTRRFFLKIGLCLANRIYI
jgi:hypothetical protein